MWSYTRMWVLVVAVALYLAIFYAITSTRPRWLFLTDGSVRPFGVEWEHTTVFPIWSLALILGIMCYLASLALMQSFL